MYVSRRILALVLFCVSLSAARLSGGDAPPAQSKVAAPEETILREALRYEGKRFEEWRTQLLTELTFKPRMKAIEALPAFAMNRYGPETAATLTEPRSSLACRRHSQIGKK